MAPPSETGVGLYAGTSGKVLEVAMRPVATVAIRPLLLSYHYGIIARYPDESKRPRSWVASRGAFRN
jgi:hypothetical protein